METQSLPVLRPLRLGELLDQAIRLYRRNFVTFVGIIAVVYIPLMILQTLATTAMSSSVSNLSSSNPEELFSNYTYWIGFLSVIILAFAQYIFVYGIASGALAGAVADSYLGKTTGIVDAYRRIGKSWLTLLGTLLFVGLLVIVIFLWWLIVPCVGWFTGFGMLAFLGAAISPMVAPVVILEKSGPWSSPTENIIVRFANWIMRILLSVRRVWSLVRRRFWPVLGYVFILYLFNLIIVNGPLAIVNFLLTAILPSTFEDPTMLLVITTIIQAIISTAFVLLYYPLQITAFTLIYFDLRVRTEGFDMTLLTTGDADQALAVSPPQADEKFMTGADLGNFAILTLGAVGIYILIFSIIFGGIFFASSLFN